MSETVYVALITGGFTLASGIIGIILTHRYSQRQADSARREERRRDVRALVAQLVSAGTVYAKMTGDLVPIYYSAAGDPNFWMEWPDTDSGREQRENAQTVRRIAGELRLMVRDSALLDALSGAMTLFADGTAMSALLAESKRTGGQIVDGGAVGDVFAYYRTLGDAFVAVENRAAELLRGDL
ncbi:hypothetical protein [Microbacterium sp. NPDC055357]